MEKQKNILVVIKEPGKAPYVGTVVAVATERDEFASIPERFIPMVLRLFEVEQ